MLYDCIKNIQTLLYPPRCLLCGQAGEHGLDLCRGCRIDLPWQGHRCERCGAAMPGQGRVCGPCLRKPPPVSRSLIPFAYRAPLDGLILGMKFSDRLAAAALLGQLLARTARQEGVALPDALLPVPMHPHRLRERGYNQAHELARVIARELQLPVFPELARRVRHTTMQSRLDGRARRHNLRDAFDLGGQTLPSHVVIVDDVVTTGSTVNELAACLLRGGAERVDVWACARAR